MLQNVKRVGKKAALAFTAAGAMLVAGSASAAIDPAVATAFAALQDDAEALSAIVIPIVVAVMALGIVISLIKTFGRKIG